jgi:hypothetical protein
MRVVQVSDGATGDSVTRRRRRIALGQCEESCGECNHNRQVHVVQSGFGKEMGDSSLVYEHRVLHSSMLPMECISLLFARTFATQQLQF